MNLNYGNFKNQTFQNVSGTITCSNFTNCIFTAFDGEVTFDKCNIAHCKFESPCKFVKSTIINSHTKPESEPVANASAPVRLKAKAAAKGAVNALPEVTDEMTDKALDNSNYNKSNYAFFNDIKGRTVDKDALCFEHPLGSNGYILVGETGICRGDFKDGKFPDPDLNYANSLVETGMHSGMVAVNIPPYIKTIFDYIQREGIGKNIKIDLSKISNQTAIDVLTNSGIELREYYFTISGISFREDDRRVMIVDLSNPNETVNFQYMFDLRQFCGTALRFNTPIKGIQKNDTGKEILRNIKDNEVVITDFVEINAEETKI